eukprot:TRINITY_DN11033_c0_g1_i1.p1 TRINITY_DN11033_c0_g1~~TRINITY_DN11033_c0_g1_i1.p1  ORF type:complete len:1052 (-),score=201.88 TRINITY_DN11033_c0_g1_i1:834-3989(-)
MELRDNFEPDDLRSADTFKKLPALARLLQMAAGGKDLTPYFQSIVESGLSPSHGRTVRLLAYGALKCCRTLTNSQWNEILPLLTDDMTGMDEEVQVAALHTFPCVTPSILQELFRTRSLKFKECFNSPSHVTKPAVRLAVLETLVQLLLHSPALMKMDRFRRDGWNLVVERLLDSCGPVCHAAFHAVQRLFSESSTRKPMQHAEEQNSGRRDRLLPAARFVQSLALPKFRLLLGRFSTLDISLRWPCIFPLTHLASVILRRNSESFGSAAISMSELATNPQLLAVEVVECHFLPLLASMDIALTYEVGWNVLYLASLMNNKAPWVHCVTDSFISLLHSDTVPCATRHHLVESILQVLPRLNSEHMMSIVYSLMSSIHDIVDLERRLEALLIVFKAIVEKLTKKLLKRIALGDSQQESTLIEQFFQSEVVQQIWNEEDESARFRREMLAGMIEACCCLTSTHKGLMHVQRVVGLHVVTACESCLTWSGPVAAYSVEAYVRTLESLSDYFLGSSQAFGTISTQKFKQFLAKCAERLPRIRSNLICAKLLYIVCKHLVANDEKGAYAGQQLLNFIKRRLVLQENSTAQPSKRVAIGRQEGDALEQELTMNCAYMLARRCPRVQGTAVSVLTIMSKRCVNEPMERKCLTLIDALSGQPAAVPQRLEEDPLLLRLVNLPPPPPDHTADHMDNLTYFLLYKRAADKLFKKSSHWAPVTTPRASASTPRGANSITAETFQASWRPVSASSDPVSIEIAHTTSHELNRVTCHVRITNITSLQLKNIQLSINIRGELQSEHSTYQITKHVPILEYEESIEWEVSLRVLRFANNSLVAQFTIHDHQEFDDDDDPDCTILGAADESYLEASSNELHTIRCVPYQIDPNEFLCSLEASFDEFLSQWNRFHPCKVYFVSLGPAVTEPILRELLATHSSFSLITDHLAGSDRSFRLAYAAPTWFHDLLCVVIHGERQSTTDKWITKVEFRASSMELMSVWQQFACTWFSGLLSKCEGVVLSDPLVASQTEDEIFGPLYDIANTHRTELETARARVLEDKWASVFG